MKILLDECVPKLLADLLSEFNVTCSPELGWAGIKNGQLLELASAQFDVFITVDYGFTTNERANETGIIVITLHAESNKYKHIKPLVPKVIELLISSPSPGLYRIVK